MKKFTRKVFSLVLALMMLTSVFGVSGLDKEVNAAGGVKYLKIYFYGGDNQTPVLTFNSNNTNTVQTPPTPEGSPADKVFDGWLLNPEKRVRFDKEIKYLEDLDKWSIPYSELSNPNINGVKLLADNGVAGKPTELAFMAAWKDKTLTVNNGPQVAQFIKYKVTFNANGGSPTPEVQEVVKGGKATAPNPAPKKGNGAVATMNNRFNGWYLNGEKYDFDTPVNGDITLVAQYGVSLDGTNTEKCTVTFDAAGGRPTPDPVKILKGYPVNKPERDPAKSGILSIERFKGWYLGNHKYDFTKPVNEDITLVAHYGSQVQESIKVNVNFDGVGGEPVPATQTIEPGTKATKPSEIPLKEGYVFEKWIDSRSGETIDFENFVVNNDVMLRASYRVAETYEIKLDPNDGVSQVSTQRVFETMKVVKPAVDPVKEGYTFKGWYKGDEKYNFDTQVKDSFTLVGKFEEAGAGTQTRRTDIKIKPEDYAKAIMVYNKKFVSGYPDGTFKPEKTITRAEIATVFVIALGLADEEPAGTASFSDIEGHWAKKNILKLAEYGLISGYPNGTFQPDGEITKAEMTAMISNYWKKKGFTPDSAVPVISDVEGHWAKTMIQGLVNHGMMDVNAADYKFFPDEKLLRGEVALTFNRITDRPIVSKAQMFADVPFSHKLYNEINTAASEVE